MWPRDGPNACRGTHRGQEAVITALKRSRQLLPFPRLGYRYRQRRRIHQCGTGRQLVNRSTRCGTRPGRLSATEHEQLQHSLDQARLVLANLQRRWKTLGRITLYLVERQRTFLEQGLLELTPLTREEVGAALELHPSTVSRAMADKAVLLPGGQVVPFSTFFTPNLRVKTVLRELVQQAVRPLSDQRLAELLHTRGIMIARRTVAKYREELGILPSSARVRCS
jgi:DNA-directed RNA polymerase specialized sigma54-like protein